MNKNIIKNHAQKPLLKTEIVGVIACEEDAQKARRRPDIADLFELRVDRTFGDHRVESAVRRLKEKGKRIIVTVRDPLEGGASRWNTAYRIRVFEHCQPLADYADIEVRNLEKFYRPIREAMNRKHQPPMKLIASCHGLDRMLTFTEINEAFKKAVNIGAYAFKLAVRIDTKHDMFRFQEYVENFIDQRIIPIVPMAIGQFGRSSRILFSRWGSIFAYGYVAKPIVDGQPSVGDLRRALVA